LTTATFVEMLLKTLSMALAALSAIAPVAAAPMVALAKLVPQNTLPPPGDLQLKYVLLGLGTQNYTCTTDNVTAIPGTTGALGE
jgi:hypothetical protein